MVSFDDNTLLLMLLLGLFKKIPYPNENENCRQNISFETVGVVKSVVNTYLVMLEYNQNIHSVNADL